jgi:hypothetical protein
MRISIVSRLDDAPGYHLRVAAQLRAIVPGVEILDDQVSTADLVLVLIGPAWTISLPDAETIAKLEEALGAKRKVVPVLVQKGKIPPVSLLPASVRSLALYSAVELRHASFSDDLDLVLKQIRDDTGAAWSAEGATGTLRIVSKDRGILLGMVGRWDNGGPVTIKIDDAVVGVMHLFGDEGSFRVAPGKHEVLLRTQFEKPIEVVVPAAGTVDLHVQRNLATGWVKVINR